MKDKLYLELTKEELDFLIGWGELFENEYGNSYFANKLLERLYLIMEGLEK